MLATKCPGQDTRYWKAEDIHEQPCPHCSKPIEFWKTDVRVRCPNCKQKVANPRFNLGCAEWCAYAEQCLGDIKKGRTPKSLRLTLEEELARLMHGLPVQMKKIKDNFKLAEEQCRKLQLEPLPVLTALMILEVEAQGRMRNIEKFTEQLAETAQFPPEALAEVRTLVNNVKQGNMAGQQEELLSSLINNKL